MSLFTTDAAPPGRPYWWDDAVPPPELPDRPPKRADVVVVGAGFTGLSAAITCADQGATVALLDAGVLGEGASTRNGGMFGAHPRLPFETVVARFDRAVAEGIYREAEPAFAFTRGLIEREGIACDLQPTGRIQLAWTRADFAAQQRLVAAVTAAGGSRMEIVEREELAREIATARYFGAIRFPDQAALDPRKLHDGMLAAALRRGVAVVRDCTVEAVLAAGSGFAVATRRGSFAADRVILATNGYTQGAFGWARRRVFPLPSFIVATEPLPAGPAARLAPARRMMVETRARHCYYRLSPDGSRIQFGGRAAMTPMAPVPAAARLHGMMTGIWPELAGVRLTHSWSGMTGYSFAHLPNVGCWRGVHYALGYSGSGVALAPYLGMKAAFRALGDARGETAYAATVLGTRPFHPGGAPHFLKAADLWYRLVVDPRQDAAARPGGPG